MDMAASEVGVPMLSEALEREDQRFDFACRATSGCLDCCFVLEDEIFWIGVSVELRENSGVEAWRLRELFELCGERRGEVLLWMKLSRTKVMWHHVLAFLFVRVLLFFDEDGLLEKPVRLRRLLHGPRGLARRFQHCQTITDGLLHCFAAKLFFS